MAYIDYVDRRKSSRIQRKTPNGKKRHACFRTSKIMILLASTTIILAILAAVLMIFISDLYFIGHNKSSEAVIVPNRDKNDGSGLPPKPVERWRYIKELENRQIGVRSATE